MNAVPRLTIGLPVYNGRNYVAEAIESLLGQTFEDFELIISDNASTDDTGDICRRYGKQDSRIRYVRQPHNIGIAPNHNFIVSEARGDLVKWASHDDLYARDMMERCVQALDDDPQVVLAHPWTAIIDGSGEMTAAIEYPLNTSSRSAPERFRSTLFANGGDDTGGVIRTEVMRRTGMLNSFHHADRTITTELALHGPFHQVPDWLYFRREFDGRNERISPTVRARCANLDPRRADPIRHPVARLYGEYVWSYVTAIRNAPLTSGERRACYGHLADYLTARVRPQRGVRMDALSAPHASGEAAELVSVGAAVAGQESRVS
ncbi:MAG TPA: glycosyltransferase family 2 protein [Streptosporangiaceae bacterium]|jgi:glycosyltransferase involved in cell wall biosynthesis